MRRFHQRIRRPRSTCPALAAAALATVLVLTGCGSPASQAAVQPTAADPAAAGSMTSGPVAPPTGGDPSADPAGYPVTVDNCGTKVIVASPPRRILAIKSTSLELLLALGVGDRVIGQAFTDSPVPAKWADAASRIPVISDQAPAQEPVLELQPDLIVAGWESNLAADTAGTRDSLAAKGIASWVSPAACREKQYQPKRLTFADLFAEFAELGRILGVPQAAASLVEQQHQELATVHKVAAGTTALWWSSGNATPYVGAGMGAPQMVMDAVGLTNIAAGVQDTWTSLGWEPIIEANPDVIILIDASWNPASKKIAALQSNPATARLDAVVHKRFIVIPFAASEAGARSAQAAVDIAAKARELGFG
jgi:iron complex transport system substrate-binding protein